MVRTEKRKNSNLGLLMALVIILLSGTVQAIPTPQGLDGFVLGLDGVTQADEGTTFTIINLDSGDILSGTTGMGHLSGRYSTTIKGITGDRLFIEARTRWHSVNRTVNLTGSMHNVNLLLNLSEPKGIPGRPRPVPFATVDPEDASPQEFGDEITSTMVPPLMIIEGESQGLDEAEGIMVTNLDTGETVVAEKLRRRSGFRAAITGQRGDTLIISHDDDRTDQLPYGLDQQDIILSKMPSDLKTGGSLSATGWISRERPDEIV